MSEQLRFTDREHLRKFVDLMLAHSASHAWLLRSEMLTQLLAADFSALASQPGAREEGTTPDTHDEFRKAVSGYVWKYVRNIPVDEYYFPHTDQLIADICATFRDSMRAAALAARGYGEPNFAEVARDKRWLLTLPDSLERAHCMTTLDILTGAVRAARPPQQEPSEPLYPCDGCGVMRTKAEGGTTFTVCDRCWCKHWHKTPDGFVCDECGIDWRAGVPPQKEETTQSVEER